MRESGPWSSEFHIGFFFLDRHFKPIQHVCSTGSCLMCDNHGQSLWWLKTFCCGSSKSAAREKAVRCDVWLLEHRRSCCQGDICSYWVVEYCRKESAEKGEEPIKRCWIWWLSLGLMAPRNHPGTAVPNCPDWLLVLPFDSVPLWWVQTQPYVLMLPCFYLISQQVDRTVILFPLYYDTRSQ